MVIAAQDCVSRNATGAYGNAADIGVAKRPRKGNGTGFGRWGERSPYEPPAVRSDRQAVGPAKNGAIVNAIAITPERGDSRRKKHEPC